MKRVLTFLVIALIAVGCGKPTLDPHNFKESIKEMGATLDSQDKKEEMEALAGLGLMNCRAEVANKVGDGKVDRMDTTFRDGDDIDDEFADFIEKHCPYLAGQTAEEILNIDNHPEY